MVLPAPLQLNSLQSSRTTGGLSSGESTTRTWIHLPISLTVRTTLRPPRKNDRFFGRYAIDEDQQELVVDEPAPGEFFGFASMLDQTPHQTNAIALEESVCIELDRHDILTLVQQKPHAAMDMLTVLGQRLHAAQQLVRGRAARNPNEIIEAEATFGERVADGVASFGGSWTFIISFLILLMVYSAINVALTGRAWDPYPFILLNLILSMLAAIQAPVIMMSQNRQDTKDRLRGELDFEVNRRAEAEIQALAGKVNLLIDKLGDLDDEVRGRFLQR